MKSLRIFAFADTHCQHNKLIVPDNIDIMICAGDFSDTKMYAVNFNECVNFFDWYKNQKATYKILVPGNHETSIEKKMFTREQFIDMGFIYLEHEEIVVEGIKFFGSPYTPDFHNWAFMRNRNKLGKYWDVIPDDTDVLITHGPPKAILDLAQRGKYVEHVGDSALLKKVMKIQPKIHIFGHVHNNEDNINAGIYKMLNHPTTFANVSCVKDGKDLEFVNNGYLFELEC